MVPRAIFPEMRPGVTASRVYGALAVRADNGSGLVDSTFEQIAADAGLSRRRVAEGVAVLIEQGWVTQARQGRGRVASKYRLHPTPLRSGVETDTTTELGQDCSGAVNDTTTEVDEDLGEDRSGVVYGATTGADPAASGAGNDTATEPCGVGNDTTTSRSGVENGTLSCLTNPLVSPRRSEPDGSGPRAPRAASAPPDPVALFPSPSPPASTTARDAVAAWVQAYRATGGRPVARQTKQAGREAKELLAAGNPPDLVLAAARAAGAKCRATIVTELGIILARRPGRSPSGNGLDLSHLSTGDRRFAEAELTKLHPDYRLLAETFGVEVPVSARVRSPA